MAHDQFEEGFALVTDKMCVIWNGRTQFELMVVKREFAVDDLADKAWSSKSLGLFELHSLLHCVCIEHCCCLE